MKDLTTKQVRERLQISKSLFHEMLEKGDFPTAYKLGSRWRIPEADLDALRQQNRKAAS